MTLTATAALLDHPLALCNAARRIVLEAGQVIMEYRDGVRTLEIFHKNDGSVATSADLEAESLITRALLDLAPGIPVIGEEAVDAGLKTNLDPTQDFWLLDPLDASREYIEDGDHFSINLALIRGGRPLIGIIYAPAKDVLYFGIPGTGAWRWSAESGREKSIRTRRPPRGGLTIYTSARNSNDKKIAAFMDSLKIEKRLRLSSALKFCAIAEGKGDLYPRFGPTGEWDVAAGEAILQAAGGEIRMMEGGLMQYGRQDRNFINPPFLAAGFEYHLPEEE